MTTLRVFVPIQDALDPLDFDSVAEIVELDSDTVRVISTQGTYADADYELIGEISIRVENIRYFYGSGRRVAEIVDLDAVFSDFSTDIILDGGLLIELSNADDVYDVPVWESAAANAPTFTITGTELLDMGGGHDVIIAGIASDEIAYSRADDNTINARLPGGELFKVRNAEEIRFTDQTVRVTDIRFPGEDGGEPEPTPEPDPEPPVRDDAPLVVLPPLGTPTISGSGVEDRLSGSAGADIVSAGGGRDVVKTAGGNDDVDLGDGNDIVLSGTGNDTVRGGVGDDVIKAAAGTDLIDAGEGADVVLSGDDDDSILGGDGNDTIKPGRGDDVIDAGAGDDIVVGFRGGEDMAGGAGDDTLLGNLGDDTLRGGAGNDRLQGGPGLDVFVFNEAEFGHDRVVLDFRAGSDTLDFRGSGLTVEDLSISQAGGNVLIEVEGYESSILVNAQRLGPLDADDFRTDLMLFDL